MEYKNNAYTKLNDINKIEAIFWNEEIYKVYKEIIINKENENVKNIVKTFFDTINNTELSLGTLKINEWNGNKSYSITF